MSEAGLKGSKIEAVKEATEQQEVLLGHGGSIIFFPKARWLKLPDFIRRGAPFSLVLTPENVVKLTGRERKLAFQAIDVEADSEGDDVSWNSCIFSISSSEYLFLFFVRLAAGEARNVRRPGGTDAWYSCFPPRSIPRLEQDA